ncbi:MAG TPA: SDR family NAD(P)-dependent oxidoreductase [Anaerolineales bacterium]|nr:SDR family NAD(P)-dependent oxidoreductase [Anaerolineales bacterium]
MLLTGRTALVTGASRGIGRAIALRLAAEGAAVALLDVRETGAAAEGVRAAGGRALGFQVDITDPAAVEAVVAETVRSWGKVDILVNNAGVIARGTLLDLTPEAWKRVLEVNVNGTFHCCRAVVPHMIARGYGRILNITSVAGKTGDVTAAPVYGTSKGALNALTKSLARQLAAHGITVNAIAPHAIETDMSAEWSAEKRSEVLRGIPLGRLGKPEEVAAAAAFLVSGEAGYITGEILDLNGGFFMD